MIAVTVTGCATSVPPARGAPSVVASRTAATLPEATTSEPTADSAPTENPTVPGSTDVPPELARAAATNKALAMAEAERILDLTPLPGGATPLSAPPKLLTGSVLGRSSTTSIVDKAKFWHVSMPMVAASSWVTEHRPANLSSSGSSRSSLWGVVTAMGVGFAAPDSDHWTLAKLDISIVPAAGGGSDIRADGMAAWWDPVPLQDTAPGERLRIDVSTGCPQSDRGFVGVRNRRQGLTDALLPSDVPKQGLACVYAGMNGKPFSLLRSTTLTATDAASLASALEGNSLRHLDNVVTSCPMSDMSATVFALSYADGPDVDVWYARDGCQRLTNGTVSATPDERLLSQVSTFVH